jgi:hypothetical protein
MGTNETYHVVSLVRFTMSNNFSHLSVGDLHAPSEPSTTPALERISMEHDVFTNDDHRPLDTKIVNTFSTFRKLNEELDLSKLLSPITMDKRITWLKIEEAEELLDREPSMARLLRNGWQAGSFKEVRQLGVFAEPLLSGFELLNTTTEILWPEMQEQLKRSVVPIEQRESTILYVFISLSHSILLSFPFS